MEYALHTVQFVCEYMNETHIIYLLIVLSIKQHWIMFLFVIIATDLKYYPQIQHTDASNHICVSQWSFTNVKASFLLRICG